MLSSIMHLCIRFTVGLWCSIVERLFKEHFTEFCTIIPRLAQTKPEVYLEVRIQNCEVFESRFKDTHVQSTPSLR